MGRVALLIETGWCVAVVTGGVLAVGLPVQWLLAGRGPLEQTHWSRAPLMGLASIVLSLQALVYMDVPVARSAPGLWAVTALLWLWMWRQGALRRRSVPGPLLAAALGVYLVHGVGLLLAGARWYVGRAWSDQFNYTVLAEFVREEPFSLGFDRIGLRPYLVIPLFMKQHRIGEAVAQGFFATSAFRDAKTLFEPTILLAPCLVFLSLYELHRVITGSPARGWALIGCAGCAVLPGACVLHLEGFLSQCLALPFLLLWPVLLREVVLDPRGRTVTQACLVVAAVTAIYGEVVPILLGLAAVGLAVAAPRHPSRARLLLAFALLVGALGVFVFTPAYRGLLETARYLGKPVLAHLYPWALSLEGLTRIWAGDLVEAARRPGRALLHAAALALTAGGYGGLLHALVGVARRGPGGPTMALGAGLLALLPLMVLAQRGEHPYQFYKLALTVAPLVALGATLLPSVRLRRLLVAPMVVFGLVGTVQLAWQAGRAVPGPRSMATYLMDADARALAGALTGLRDRDLVLLQRDPVGRPPGVVNAWLAYLARRNRVWLGNPILNQDFDLRNHPPLHHMLDLASVPAGAAYLTTHEDPWTDTPAGATALWSSPHHVLWHPSRGPWGALIGARNPNGLEEVHGRRFLWLGGGETRLYVLAGDHGVVQLSAEVWKGPGERSIRPLVRVRTEAGHDETVELGPGSRAFGVPVSPGVQEVRLMPLDPGRAPGPQDPRPLSVGLLGLEVTFARRGDLPPSAAR